MLRNGETVTRLRAARDADTLYAVMTEAKAAGNPRPSSMVGVL